MKVWDRKPHKDEHVGFTIGTMEAELSADVIKKYSLGPALKRIGKALTQQYRDRHTRDGNQDVIGVNIRNLGFNLLLAGKNMKKEGRHS